MMKTTIFVLTAILALQFNSLLAGNAETKSASSKEPATIIVVKLAPAQSMDEEFSKITPNIKTENLRLAPVTPAEADFRENEDTSTINLRNLAPVVPAEADFK